MSTYYKKDGTVATATEWLAEMQTPERVVGYKVIEVNSKKLEVFSFFTGLGDEPEIYEVTVNGNLVDHPTYHGYQEHFANSADCLTDHDRVVAAIEAGDPI